MEADEHARLQSTATELQRLQHYLQALEEQTMEVAKALESIEQIQQEKEGTQAYVPLTNGIYIKAKLEDTKEFLINAGNNIITAHTPQEAAKLLQEQQAELEKAQEQLSERFSSIYQEYLRLQLRLQEGS